MTMDRPNRAVRFTIITTTFSYSVLLWISDVKLDSVAKQIGSLLPALGSAAACLWDLVLWRQFAFRILHRRPRLDGLWAVSLTPTKASVIPDGGNTGPINAFLVISQSFWSIHVRLLTAESTSDSRTFTWARFGRSDVESLSFLYGNRPTAAQQPRSPAHSGACTLQSGKRVPASVTGSYFTDRYTKGDITGSLIDRSRGYVSFQEANDHVAGQK